MNLQHKEVFFNTPPLSWTLKSFNIYHLRIMVILTFWVYQENSTSNFTVIKWRKMYKQCVISVTKNLTILRNIRCNSSWFVNKYGNMLKTHWNLPNNMLISWKIIKFWKFKIYSDCSLQSKCDIYWEYFDVLILGFHLMHTGYKLIW